MEENCLLDLKMPHILTMPQLNYSEIDIQNQWHLIIVQMEVQRFLQMLELLKCMESRESNIFLDFNNQPYMVLIKFLSIKD